MLIDEPELDNQARVNLAVDALLRGEISVQLWVERRGLQEPHAYQNWIRAVLRERGCSDMTAEILASGVTVRMETAQ